MVANNLKKLRKVTKKRRTSIGSPSFLWRSRRDLNPRYPFGVHTISSRARYDHFDTAPCGCLSDSFHIVPRFDGFVKHYFSKKNRCKSSGSKFKLWGGTGHRPASSAGPPSGCTSVWRRCHCGPSAPGGRPAGHRFPAGGRQSCGAGCGA